jgi:hypothetical protein
VGTEEKIAAVFFLKICGGRSNRIGRATVDEDGQYCFALALWSRILTHAKTREYVTDCD